MSRLYRIPLSSRRVRQLRVASLHWQRLTIFVLGGITVGAAAVALALGADASARLFQALLARWPWAAMALPEIRFAIQSLLNAGFRNAVQIALLAIGHAPGRLYVSVADVVNEAAGNGRIRR